MKKYLWALLIVGTCLISCRTLKSTTYISPNKEFVLGQGKHGSYKAQLTNVDEADIEIVLTDLEGNRQSAGILYSGTSQNLKKPPDKQVSFVNLGEETAAVRLKLVGDTRLSMDYQ